MANANGQKCKSPDTSVSRLFAEGEGFKPPIPEMGIPDFESSAIDHSANLPIADANLQIVFELTKLFER